MRIRPYPPVGPAGGVLAGTYPNPGFAADQATQAELDAHAALTGQAAHGGNLDEWFQLVEVAAGFTYPRGKQPVGTQQPTGGTIYGSLLRTRAAHSATGLQFITGTAFAGATDFRIGLYTTALAKIDESANLGNPGTNSLVQAAFGAAQALAADTWYVAVLVVYQLTAGTILRLGWSNAPAIPVVSGAAYSRQQSGYTGGSLPATLTLGGAAALCPLLETY